MPKKDWRRHKGPAVNKKSANIPKPGDQNVNPHPQSHPLGQYDNFIAALKKGTYKPPPPPGPPMRYYPGGATRFGRGGKSGNVWMNSFEACKSGVQAGPARLTRDKGHLLVDLTNQSDDFTPLPPEDVREALAWEEKMLSNSVIIKQEPDDDYEMPPTAPPMSYTAPKPVPMEVSENGLPEHLKFSKPDQLLLNARADYEGRYYYST